MKNFIVILLASCLATVYARVSHRIVGGSDAPEGKYPYQAYLKNKQGFLCGAAIVDKRYLLTAAHCVSGVNAVSVTAVVGTVKLSEADGQTYRAETFIVHENYTRPGGDHGVNDIALVRLREDIVFNDKVQPVKLPSGDFKIPDETAVSFTGWGDLKYGGKRPTTLQQIQLAIYNQAKCGLQWLSLKFLIIEKTMICTAGKYGSGVCNGDSGSPLVVDGTLVGISSFGYPCAYGYPDVFTRVTSYVDWIEETLKDA